MNYLEENNVLGEVQGAFRKGRRTEDHIFTLQGIIVLLCCIRKSKKCKTYLAFLDLCKAFDRVWHEGFSTYFGKMGYTTNVGNSLSRFIAKFPIKFYLVNMKQSSLIRSLDSNKMCPFPYPFLSSNE